MSEILKYENSEVEDKVILIRNQHVIIDSDVAELYGVETRNINKAVKNNPDKFPKGYIFEITKEELENLRWKFSTAKLSKTRIFPKAFTEKGFYMLATIEKQAGYANHVGYCGNIRENPETLAHNIRIVPNKRGSQTEIAYGKRRKHYLGNIGQRFADNQYGNQYRT